MQCLCCSVDIVRVGDNDVVPLGIPAFLWSNKGFGCHLRDEFESRLTGADLMPFYHRVEECISSRIRTPKRSSGVYSPESSVKAVDSASATSTDKSSVIYATPLMQISHGLCCQRSAG